MTSPAPAPLHLLDLPVEILSQIFGYLVTLAEKSGTSGAIPLCPCRAYSCVTGCERDGLDADNRGTWSGLFSFPNPVLPVLLVHPRLHAIACPLLYASNRFILDLTGEHHAHMRRWIKDRTEAEMTPVERRQEFHGTLMPREENDGQLQLPTHRALFGIADALRRIVKLDVRISRPRSWIQEDIVPVVSDMTIRGSLAQVNLVLVGAAALTMKRKDAFLRPPLCGLVGLLADPYLKSGRLWVEKAAKRREIGTGEMEVVEEEVDWHQILREVDPKGEVFPTVVGIFERV